MLGAIEMRAERDAVVANLAEITEAENLKAAGVGKDRMRPGHESMQAAQLANQFVAGTKIKMIGICEDDLSAEGFEILLRLPSHRRGGTDGHECWCINRAVRRRQPPKPRTGWIG